MLETGANVGLRQNAFEVLNDRLAEFGFPQDGDRRLLALRALLPALMSHLEGDVSPVPARHAFIDPSGEVRINSALNSERIDTPSGVVLYMNLRQVADTIQQKSA